MIHPDTELRKINDEIGCGVYATKKIPKGSITWALDPLDRVFHSQDLLNMPKNVIPIIERYAFRDAHANYVFCWDHGRYVNHSCNSSSLPLGSICEIAIRDIAPGEEITSDYATLNLTQEMLCQCGASNCRKIMRPSDLSKHIERIDHIMSTLLPFLSTVPQPVLPFMLKEEKARFEAIAQNKVILPSCIEVIGTINPSLHSTNSQVSRDQSI